MECYDYETDIANPVGNFKTMGTLNPEIISAIESEIDYQNLLWKGDAGKNHSIAAWILFMEHHLAEARKIASTTSPETPALDHIRKCVTLGVRCMDEHGAPLRVIPESLLTPSVPDRCDKHPSYKALRYPTSECPTCLAIWNSRQTKTE